jgi:hypothetical protein
MISYCGEIKHILCWDCVQIYWRRFNWYRIWQDTYTNLRVTISHSFLNRLASSKVFLHCKICLQGTMWFLWCEKEDYCSATLAILYVGSNLTQLIFSLNTGLYSYTQGTIREIIQWWSVTSSKNSAFLYLHCKICPKCTVGFVWWEVE